MDLSSFFLLKKKAREEAAVGPILTNLWAHYELGVPVLVVQIQTFFRLTLPLINLFNTKKGIVGICHLRSGLDSAVWTLIQPSFTPLTSKMNKSFFHLNQQFLGLRCCLILLLVVLVPPLVAKTSFLLLSLFPI